MNEAEFERRAETNAAMFRDKITRRNPGKSRKEVRRKEGPMDGGLVVFTFLVLHTVPVLHIYGVLLSSEL